MASAFYKSSVIGAFVVSVLGTSSTSATPTDFQNHAAIDASQTAHCLSADQATTPSLPTDTILNSLKNILGTLENLYLHEFIYIEDYIHELPETPEGEIITRAVFDYYDEVQKHLDGGIYYGLPHDQLTPDILKPLSNALLGYVDVVESIFGTEDALQEAFANITVDLTTLEAYTAQPFTLVGVLPCTPAEPVGTENMPVAGTGLYSDPVPAF